MFRALHSDLARDDCATQLGDELLGCLLLPVAMLGLEDARANLELLVLAHLQDAELVAIWDDAHRDETHLALADDLVPTTTPTTT